ncbi:MAG: hypothetical protein KKC46_17265 [Proteobacteria bacterium]|nr:hypothetical protein [Pseudomonadota bacterium]
MGIFSQILIMPALGFMIGELLYLSIPPKLGPILVGCIPGAMVSNVIAYLARTDVAYSITLTSIAILISPVLAPALLLFYAHTLLDRFLRCFLRSLR